MNNHHSHHPYQHVPISYNQPYQYPYNFPYSHHLPDDVHRPSFFSYSPDVIKHRKRTSRTQRKILEEAFRNNPKPSQYTRKLLIHQTGMERRAIQVWFQNRRAKEKKLAAKASQGQGASAPVLAKQDDDNDNDLSDPEEEDDEDESPTEAPASPHASNLKNANTARIKDEQMQSTNTVDGFAPLPMKDSLVQSTPSPRDLSDASSNPPTSNSTSSGSAATNSPRPSSRRTGSPPSPVGLWRSHECTPALRSKLPLSPDIAFALRRESAPAPLGIDYPAHPHNHSPFHGMMLPGNTDDRVAIWEGGTPPSPLSSTEDIVSLRRGSLPTFRSHHHHAMNMDDSIISLDDDYSIAGLPSVPSDPAIRRMSLERSRQRLASHPYANQVAANNRAYLAPRAVTSEYTHTTRFASNLRPSLPHVASAPLPAHSTHLTTGHADTGGNASWDNSPMSNSQPDGFPTYVRPRRHGSYHSGMYNDTSNNAPASHRTYAEIVPGPLPAPNFSFGTAPIAPISENETGTEDEDTGTGTSYSLEDMHRGSLASITSTESSLNSAWYSDVPSHGMVNSEELEVPTAWQPDVRRASCPVPFVYAFSGLQLNQDGHQVSHIGSVDNLGLALDLNDQKQPLHASVDVPGAHEDGSSVGHDVHSKLPGSCVPGYTENGTFYTGENSFPQANGYSEEYHYSNLNGYTADRLDQTPTAASTPGAVFPYYQH